MKDFGWRFPAALGVAGFGVAGFVSLYYGSTITGSLIKSAMAGAALFIIGKVLAAAIYEGPVTTPTGEFGDKEDEKE
ncbi:MAG: hypothetical protein HY751_09110 [Nitrospinae bacterium]|nr:hypothetical protein [Nitrospinota bacterium]